MKRRSDAFYDVCNNLSYNMNIIINLQVEDNYHKAYKSIPYCMYIQSKKLAHAHFSNKILCEHFSEG